MRNREIQDICAYASDKDGARIDLGAVGVVHGRGDRGRGGLGGNLGAIGTGWKGKEKGREHE